MSLKPWFPYVRTSPHARLRLFCLHHAGGSASVYRSWSRKLPQQIEVWAVQLPGRESRFHERAFTRIEPLLTELVPAMEPHLGLPYAIFGHSMGAHVGFELARELGRRPVPGPVHLMVSGLPAPHVPPRAAPAHRLPDPEFLAWMKELSGTPAEVYESRELLELVMSCLRVDCELLETIEHRAGAPLGCPISALGGAEDSYCNLEELEAWGTHTARFAGARLFPGGHFYLQTVEDEVLRVIAQALSAHL